MDPISGSIGAASSTLPLALTPPGGNVAAGKKGDFSAALNQALEQVSLKQNQADDYAKRFQMGDSNVSLEKTMVALQTANISFQAMVQVRNRVVSAYQDIMNMQV